MSNKYKKDCCGGVYEVELLKDKGIIEVEMFQYEMLPVETEVRIACYEEDWVLMNRYYVFSIPSEVHKKGFYARASGAESQESEAVVSYKRLPNNTILIYSNIPFEGTIFIRG